MAVVESDVFMSAALPPHGPSDTRRVITDSLSAFFPAAGDCDMTKLAGVELRTRFTVPSLRPESLI